MEGRFELNAPLDTPSPQLWMSDFRVVGVTNK